MSVRWRVTRISANKLQLATQDPRLAEALQGGIADIKSITRAKQVEIVEQLDLNLEVVKIEGAIVVALASEA